MLFFREHYWLPVPGRSVIEAHIGLHARTPEDVSWHLILHFVAGGARWRRVLQTDRPSIEVRVGFFKPGIAHWTELERVSFWCEERRERVFSEAGVLEVRYRPGPGEKPIISDLVDHIWRVAAREGRVFTVELAAFANGRNIYLEMAGVSVTAEGEEEPVELDEEFWKANAQLYLIEHVPLGRVQVTVARNAGNPEAVARNRVRALLGLEQVEYAQVWDFASLRSEFAEHTADMHVKLQYHGFYED